MILAPTVGHQAVAHPDDVCSPRPATRPPPGARTMFASFFWPHPDGGDQLVTSELRERILVGVALARAVLACTVPVCAGLVFDRFVIQRVVAGGVIVGESLV